MGTAEADLKITQVQYDTGAASKVDLITAQSNLVQAKQSLLYNICQHQLDVMSFETPWASS